MDEKRMKRRVAARGERGLLHERMESFHRRVIYKYRWRAVGQRNIEQSIGRSDLHTSIICTKERVRESVEH